MSSFLPTPNQLAAADPRQSVWVSANAGSGKTHVLVERVIRLMLAGAEPSSILCLTFTKAAAAEMSARLFRRLGEWVSLSDDALHSTLERMGTRHISIGNLTAARRLFTRALETPGGLKIQTIHAFCEKLLHLFPVEAGLAPGFKLLGDREQIDLRNRIISDVLRSVGQSGDDALDRSIQHIVNSTNSESFEILMREFLSDASGYRALISSPKMIKDYQLVLKHAAGLDVDASSEDVHRQICQFDRDAYELHATYLGSHKAFYGHDVAYMMLLALKADDPFDLLKEMAFKKDGEARGRPFFSRDFSIEFPDTADFLENEKSRTIQLIESHDMYLRIESTEKLLNVAQAIHAKMLNHKRLLGVYDFDDLISATEKLLSSSRATQWVLYKLDAGLKHILVDEAQDTSPKQWRIIKALSEEFFAGQGAERDETRTVFVVGDRKQSIFSFQGADVRAMQAARLEVEEQSHNSKHSLKDVDLSISYRSTAEILKFVDKVFPHTSPAQLGIDTSSQPEHPHQTDRLDEPGLVEIWPLIEPIEDEEDEPWQAPLDRIPAQHPRRLLAKSIAGKIKSWIGSRVIAARNRVVRPDDILILLQSRGPLFGMLIAELRKLGVPVAGADRLRLSDSLAIQDLLILGQWLLLPEDDHALACILKSPFVPQPLNEELLFELAHGRATQSLFRRLAERADSNFVWLSGLLAQARSTSPHLIFTKVLTQFRKAMISRLGTEAIDASDAFLDQILIYESENSPSLSGFVHWFSQGETNLKREMEKSSGEVRLMTVHGAKGLEANIVILPDTASVTGSNSKPKLITIPENEAGAGLPIWKTGQMVQSTVLNRWEEAADLMEQAESNRLLYVALTRACDELYICGISNNQKLPSGCWYETICKALGISEVNHVVRFGSIPVSQTSASTVKSPTAPLPDWVFEVPAPEVADTTQSLTSLIQRNSKGYDARAAKRGVAIHSLLQVLPNYEPEKRLAFAIRRAKQLNLDEAYAHKLVELLNAPELAIFFGPESGSEVEMYGTLEDGEKVTGRLDRLAISNDTIALLDYKSDQIVPQQLSANHPYIEQMALYSKLLAEAYPTHLIKAALLWTETGRLDHLPPEILGKALDQAQSGSYL